MHIYIYRIYICILYIQYKLDQISEVPSYQASLCFYIFIYIYSCVCVYIYISIYIVRMCVCIPIVVNGLYRCIS